MLSTEHHYREDYRDTGHKYGSPMAKYVSLNLGLQDADDSYADPDLGEGWAQYGRRILRWDDRGFVDLDTYTTVEEASAAVDKWHQERGPVGDWDGIVSEDRGGYYVTAEGVAVGSFDNQPAAYLALARWMVDHGTFGDSFAVNSRGNFNRIDDEIRELHDAGGDRMREDLADVTPDMVSEWEHLEDPATIPRECVHCGRTVTREDGSWIDPEATGDDVVWREVCDGNDTERAAPHEVE